MSTCTFFVSTAGSRKLARWSAHHAGLAPDWLSNRMAIEEDADPRALPGSAGNEHTSSTPKALLCLPCAACSALNCGVCLNDRTRATTNQCQAQRPPRGLQASC